MTRAPYQLARERVPRSLLGASRRHGPRTEPAGPFGELRNPETLERTVVSRGHGALVRGRPICYHA